MFIRLRRIPKRGAEKMSEWVSRVKDHVIWGLLHDFGGAIDAALVACMGSSAPDHQSLAGLERIKTVLIFTGRRLQSVDPALVQHPLLDNLVSNFQNARSSLITFVS